MSKKSKSKSSLSKTDQAIIQALKEKADLQAFRTQPFPLQDAFVGDKAQFLAALCTRRAGKTSGLARRFKRTMNIYPGSLSRFIALTRDSAKDIMWGVLQEMDEVHKWECRFIESSLTMIAPNNARLRLYGADMKNFTRRLRGVKSPANAIDEAQEFGDHLANLVDDVITPSMADYPESWLCLSGTPGPVPRGTFYDITEHGNADYSIHKWSLYDNPYLPDARGFVGKLKARKKWDDKNPTYLREYQGVWVLDLESLLIRYNDGLNHYASLPTYPWSYIMGVDIGHKDADALAVLAWSPATPDIYLVEELTTAGQDITQLTNQIEAMRKKYEISKIVMDEGALGKKIGEEIRRRKHIPIMPADKARKMENVAFLNDYLRLGRFKAKSDSRFAQDSYQLQIDHDKSTPDRCVVKKGFHSDIIDAVLYAFKESPGFAYQKPEATRPKWGTPELQALEVSEMEQEAQEYFEAQENLKTFGHS